MKSKLFSHEICAKCYNTEPVPKLKETMAWSVGGRPLGLAGLIGIFARNENKLIRIKPTGVVIIPLKKVHDKKYIPEQLDYAPKSWKWNRTGKYYDITLNLHELIQYFETHPDFVYVEDNYWAMNQISS